MPRKNHLDISYSRLQHNQECRSKNHLKEEHVKVPVEVMSGSKYILILCENKNIYRQRTCNKKFPPASRLSLRKQIINLLI